MSLDYLSIALNLGVSFRLVSTDSEHHLDGKHVVFGEVVEGLEVLKLLEAQGSDSGKTKVPVTITDSGQL